MKRKNMTLVLGLALICGGLAAYLSFTYLRSSGASGVAVASEPASSQVIVAARDMQIGRVITPADIKQVDWPSGNMPLGYSSSPAEVVGRGLLTPVRANEPLLTNKLALKEAGGGLTITIPEGKRAMSVKVDEVIGRLQLRPVASPTRFYDNTLKTHDGGTPLRLPWKIRYLYRRLRWASL